MKTSALVPCYRAARFLKDCLYSLREFDEIILYLDGSDNEDWLVADHCSKHLPQLQVIASDRIGQQAARNLLYGESTGDAILWFDADDQRIEGSLASQLETLQEEGVDCSVGSYILYYCNPLKRRWGKYEFTEQPSKIYEDFGSMITTYQTGCFLWRRTALDRLIQRFGYLWDEEQPALNEYWLVLNAIKLDLNLKCCPIHTHLYRWGWDDNQITHDITKYSSAFESYASQLIDILIERGEVEAAEYVEFVRANRQHKLNKRRGKFLQYNIEIS